MRSYTFVIERCVDTGLLVGHVTGIPGAHSQGETEEELKDNLREVLELLGEGGLLVPESEFVGTQSVEV